MATMSFMDEMKDKASRIIPSAYSELVEETTSDVLMAPNFQNILFICDSANSNPENIVDIVRAVRRRIDNKSAKVQYFTIQVLDALIKNCGLSLHLEVADTKGLLHDVFLLATRKPARDGDKEANTAALTLILNLSLWFSGHPDERVKVLAELADQVRKACGPNVFDGIDPDTTVQIRRNVAPAVNQQQRRVATRQRRQEEEYLRIQQEQAALTRHQPRVVAAIPLIFPTEEEISGMLDACLLLAECMNTAEAQGAPIVGDEIIAGVASQIRKDHRNLSMILSSGAEIPNMEMLFNVTDSQTSIIQRLAEIVKKERRHDAEAYDAALQQSAAAAPPGPPVTAPSAAPPPTVSAAPPHPGTTAPTSSKQSIPEGTRRQPLHVREAADTEDYVEMQESAVARPAPPTMDEIFGGIPSSSAPPQPTPSSAFPAPSQDVNHLQATPAAISHSDQPKPLGSVNNEETDEFDNFLNSRLRQ